MTEAKQKEPTKKQLQPILQARRTGSAEIVGIGEMCISEDPGDVLVTYSLGSCIGLALHDPVCGIGGLIHCMLPLSRMKPKKADKQPGMFVDTGVLKLLEEMFERGASRQHLVSRLAGSAHMLDKSRTFRIGKRNYTVLRKILWKNDILIDAHDIGGTTSRTLFFQVGSGQTVVKKGGTFTLL